MCGRVIGERATGPVAPALQQLESCGVGGTIDIGEIDDENRPRTDPHRARTHLDMTTVELSRHRIKGGFDEDGCIGVHSCRRE